MVVFEQCTPSLQSVMKGVPEYEKKSKDCDCLWIMEELKKITAVVDVKASPRMSQIEQLISFITMHQGADEINDDYFDSFNSIIQNLIPS